MESLRIQARFLVATPTRILHGGQIVVRHGNVMDVTEGSKHKPDVELPNSILLPGLINAHTHLEFSDLESPLPAGTHFPDWIGSVVQRRREIVEQMSPASQLQHSQSTIARGLREASQTGSILVGDIVTNPWKPSWLNCDESEQSNLATDLPSDSIFHHTEAKLGWAEHLSRTQSPKVIAFPEIIGLEEERFESNYRWARATTNNNASPFLLHSIGISPHAPYSVLFPRLSNLLTEVPSQAVVAMHLAESTDELQWLEQGTGAFREAFQRLQIPLPDQRPQVADCIEFLMRAHRGLLVHGNYLNSQQVASLSDSPTVSVVYCPRTHAHFGHSEYPLAQLLKSGIRVVLGTDSRASSPDLNIWSDVVHLRTKHPWVSPEQALAMVTSDSSVALGIETEYGTLKKGKKAAIAHASCMGGDSAKDILEALTLSDRSISQLVT